MANLTFSMLQLIQEEQKQGERFVFPTKESFSQLPDNFNITIDGTFYEVIIDKAGEFIWFGFDYNSADPRDENVTNVTTGEKRPNDRTIEEAELIHQVFFLYHYSANILYTSNAKKKHLVEKVLKCKLKQDFTVKTIFKNFDDFINVLKDCQEISFTHSRNLFSANNKRRQALIDLTGTDAPENFTLKAKYSKPIIGDFLRELRTEKQVDELDALIISGIDESNFAITYNADSFSKKIDVYCKKEDNGKFNPSTVKNALVIQIGNERN